MGDAFSDPGTYANYLVVSGNGIGGFSFTGSAEGNISIDNLSVNAGAVPLPAALPLFAAGLGAMGLAGWRRKRKVGQAVAA